MFLLHKFWKMLRRRKCALLVLGLLIFLQDVQLAATESSPQSSGGNTSQNKSESHQWSIFDLLKPPPLVKNILDTAQDVAHKVLPIIPLHTDNPKNPIRDLFNAIPFNPFKDVFEVKTTTTTTTTTPAPTTTKPHFGGLLGNFFNMIMNHNAPGPTTTTTTEIPAPPGGRGVGGLVFNAESILNNLVELKNVVEFKETHWVPGFAVKKLQEIVESVKALRDIILQSDLRGGLKDIPKNIRSIFKGLQDLNNLLKSKVPGHMLFMPGTLSNLFQSIGALKDDFMIKLPPATTQEPGIDMNKIGLEWLPDKNESRSHNNSALVLDPNRGEVEQILEHGFKLITSIMHIENMIEKHNPNSPLLKFLGQIRQEMENTLQHFQKMDKQSILDTIQNFLPDNSIASMVGKVGEILKKMFPKNDLVQTIGNLLEQEMLVNFVLSNLKNIGIDVKVGSIKDTLLQTAQGVGNKLIKADPGHFVLSTIESLEEKAVSFEAYLKLFQAFKQKLKLNMTQGNIIRQFTSKMSSLISDKETLEFFKQTLLQIFHLLPINFIKNLREGLDTAKQDILGGGPIRRIIFYGGPIRRMIFSGGPIRQIINYIANFILRPIKHMLNQGMNRTR